MDALNVKVPEQLKQKIEEKADERGVSKSEKVRSDLMQIYFED